jgi:hypothetical protein
MQLKQFNSNISRIDGIIEQQRDTIELQRFALEWILGWLTKKNKGGVRPSDSRIAQVADMALRGMDVRIVMREETIPTEELARCPECGEPVTCCTCYHCMPNPTV